MAERDPFGRLPDENPLAGLGWLSDGSDGQGAAEPVSASWGSAADEATSEPVEALERSPAGERAPMAAWDEPPAAAVPGLQPAQVLAFVRRVIRIARIIVAFVVALIVVMIALGIAFGDDDPSPAPESEPSGAVPALRAPPPPASGEDSSTFGDVNTAAPARIARGAARRLKRPVSQVDYVALVGTGPRATWTVVMRGSGQFVGDARGRITRRVG